jgi:hypothetical protein
LGVDPVGRLGFAPVPSIDSPPAATTVTLPPLPGPNVAPDITPLPETLKVPAATIARKSGMHFGGAMFFTDYSMSAMELARALEERGFRSVWASEHSHYT